MKIIDSKGRLFGLINLLDLVILVLIVSLAASVVSSRMIAAKAAKTSPAASREGKELVLKVIFSGQANEIFDDATVLREGDSDTFGRAVLEKVVEVRRSKEGKSDAVVLIRAKCNLLDRQYYCGNMLIKLNALFNFATPRYVFNNGTIVGIEEAGTKR